MNKYSRWIVGPAAVLLTAGAVNSAHAAPGGPLTGTRLAAKGAGKKGKKANSPANRDIRQLEQVLGQPLTAEQHQSVVDAYQSYHESVAKAVGLTTAELDAKTKAYRQAHPGQGQRGANAPATPPVTTPPVTTPPVNVPPA